MADASQAVEGKMAPAPAVGIPVSVPGGDEAGGVKGKLAAMGTRAKEIAVHIHSQMKPWSEMLSPSALSKPEGLGDAMSRIRKNARYFKFNYLTVTFAVTALTFIFDPASLGWLVALAAMWFYLLIVRTEPLTINGRQLGSREQSLAGLVISFIVVFFLTSVGGELIYAMFLSAAVVAAHGAFRVPDELFLDDDVESSTLIPTTTAVSLQTAMAQVTAAAS